MRSTLVIVGGSRGIGRAVAAHYEARGEEVFSVSRTPSPHGRWIPADVSEEAGITAVQGALSGRAVRALLYLGGVWEEGAFTERYSFRSSPPREIRAVLAVNLLAPILLVQALLPNLEQHGNARVVLMGAFAGLQGTAGPEVANTASKAGLRGAAAALNLSLRRSGIGVTILNLDNVATPEVLSDIGTGVFGAQVPIPLADVIATIDFVLAVSPHAIPTEIGLAQKSP